MRGSGKTTNGRNLAEFLKWKFFDVDHVFEEKKNMTVKEFVTTGGGSWLEFRKLEAEILEELVKENPTGVVISTGIGEGRRGKERKKIGEGRRGRGIKEGGIREENDGM
jgi:shikimate kinase